MTQEPQGKRPTTALQRLTIRSLGHAVPDDCDKDQLKRCYNEQIGPTWGRPTPAQLDMADRWGVFVDPDATQQDLSGSLLDFMLCRAWVYSVLRHRKRERWKFYPPDVLPDERATAIAAELMADADLYRQIKQCEPSAKFIGDVWYRFDAPRTELPVYRFVLDRLEER